MNPRSRAARIALRTVAAASRFSRIGSGSTIGGRVAMLIQPRMLEVLGSSRVVALVSGTNGKTTTTSMLAAALRLIGPVATSPEGANMPAGLITALEMSPESATAVLEVDEGYLASVGTRLSPDVIVLLNLSRDQLDRVGEVRMIAERWRSFCATTNATIVANADDPLVVYAASLARSRRFVAAGTLWRNDAYHCPHCNARITFAMATPQSSSNAWSCRCGFGRPTIDAEVSGALLIENARQTAINVVLPGRFNISNAAMAAIAADVIGITTPDALAAIADVREVAGRFARSRIGEVEARMMLAKNPAGWTELLELVRHNSEPIVIAINARDADGHDPSWLWDVPFELLQGRFVFSTGDRRRDLAVRLHHAGLSVKIIQDPLEAFGELRHEHVDVIANYTAFQSLRRTLSTTKAAVNSSSKAAKVKSGEDVIVSQRASFSPRLLQGAALHHEIVRIVTVHPDLLGTYGDGGNARVLASRARWRGYEAELLIAESDEELPRSGAIYCLGGGEDGPQIHSANVLRDTAFGDVVADGAVVLGVCAGYQILGLSFPAGSDLHAGIAVLDVETVHTNDPRAVGEIVVDPTGETVAIGRLTGFENHAGRTRLSAGTAALGTTTVGVGNDEQLKSDGAVSGRVYGTYLHGPVLARNPAFADHLLSLALGEQLEPLDDIFEQELRRERLEDALSHRRFRRHVS